MRDPAIFNDLPTSRDSTYRFSILSDNGYFDYFDYPFYSSKSNPVVFSSSKFTFILSYSTLTIKISLISFSHLYKLNFRYQIEFLTARDEARLEKAQLEKARVEQARYSRPHPLSKYPSLLSKIRVRHSSELKTLCNNVRNRDIERKGGTSLRTTLNVRSEL